MKKVLNIIRRRIQNYITFMNKLRLDTRKLKLVFQFTRTSHITYTASMYTKLKTNKKNHLYNIKTLLY